MGPTARPGDELSLRFATRLVYLLHPRDRLQRSSGFRSFTRSFSASRRIGLSPQKFGGRWLHIASPTQTGALARQTFDFSLHEELR
jgi:hypothetical protein